MVVQLNNSILSQQVVDAYAAGPQRATFPGSQQGGHHQQFPVDRVDLTSQKVGLQSTTEQGQKGNSGEKSLTEEEQTVVRELKQRDQEVRAHEQAHIAAGGGLVQGGASYQFQRGPDGHMYAVGGEVSIDTSSERDPDQTIRKMQQVKRAALSPADPSGTDKGVAARASQLEAQARMEKMQASMEEDQNERSGRKGDSSQNEIETNPYAAAVRNIPHGEKINLLA